MIQATPAHASLLATLHASCFPQDPWPASAFLGLLALPGMHGLIDERGGFLLLRTVLDEAELITIGAVPRRQGIAKSLLAEAVNHLKTQKIATLHLEVAATNHPALTLYTTTGFTQSGRRKAYYPDGTDALTLRLDLASRPG